MIKKRFRNLILGIEFTTIFISIFFIGFNIFVIIHQYKIIEEQQLIMNENRKWVENVPSYEVYGLEDNVVEGAEAYFTALSKYKTAVQTQIIAIILILILCMLITISVWFLLKFLK